MPNHVTTRCRVSGNEEALKKFKETHVVLDSDRQDKGHFLDFRTVIPMPECVARTESSTEAANGYLLLTGKEMPGWTSLGRANNEMFMQRLRERAKLPPTATREEVLAWFRANEPGVINVGQATVDAIETTGCASWYEWSIKFWGTKWNSYDFKVVEDRADEFHFLFDTAWNFPEPVFRKLAEMYPALVFKIYSYDEGSNFACRGEFNGDDDFETVDATKELYELTYGEPPERDEEDEEETEAEKSE